jgi:ABC-type branched-subunit amino acid transport system ATPase component
MVRSKTLAHRQLFLSWDGLSGSERKMLAVGRALIRDPEWLLFDEPSSPSSEFIISKGFG